jgi:hypothetical protein
MRSWPARISGFGPPLQMNLVAAARNFVQSDPGEDEFMTRREIVVLVSRALAIIQLMSALIEITYIPDYLLNLFHHIIPLQFPFFGDYWSRYYMEALLALVARVAILLLAALLLWKCGPKIEQMLLPRDAAPAAESPQA